MVHSPSFIAHTEKDFHILPKVVITIRKYSCDRRWDADNLWLDSVLRSKGAVQGSITTHWTGHSLFSVWLLRHLITDYLIIPVESKLRPKSIILFVFLSEEFNGLWMQWCNMYWVWICELVVIQLKGWVQVDKCVKSSSSIQPFFSFFWYIMLKCKGVPKRLFLHSLGYQKSKLDIISQ